MVQICISLGSMLIFGHKSCFFEPTYTACQKISKWSLGQHHGNSEDYSVMNIDDFLQENGFDKNETENDSCSDGAQSPRSSNDMDIKGIYYYQVFSNSSDSKFLFWFAT